MRYKKLGKSGLDISVIGHGTWSFGSDVFGAVEEKSCIDAIHASLDAGVNLIDTAPCYGPNREAEKIVGKAISDRREKVFLATKSGSWLWHGEYFHACRKRIVKPEFENSLRYLKTDYVDLLFVHAPDPERSVEQMLEAFIELKQDGKIKAIGVSNFNVAQLKEAMKYTRIDCVQPPFSMLDRSCVENGLIPFCEENDIAVMSYGSLCGGLLAGMAQKPVPGKNEERSRFYPQFEEPYWSKSQELIQVLRQIAEQKNTSVATVSIAWALAQKGITCSLMGSSSAGHATRNAQAADVELSDAELSIIDENHRKIFGN